jgi:hypothetical protein
MNGQSFASTLTLASVSGYVQQEDLFIGTVRYLKWIQLIYFV